MTIEKALKDGELTVKVSGSLNTATSPELANELKAALPGVSSLVLDFSDLTYISSAGLRAVRGASKAMAAQGKMVVRGCSADVREVFDFSGFSNVIAIE